MIANYHTHTRRCGHAEGEEREYVEQAIAAGVRILGFSDHTPYPFSNGYESRIRMRLSETEDYFKTVTDLKRDMTSLNNVTKTPVKSSAQVGESEPEGQGVETPPEKKPMKTAHVYDSNLEGDYSPLVPKASAKPKAQPQPQPEAPAGAEAPAEQAPEQE